MLDLVMELERNGRNLQHFCRELARYFRNLLVAKVAGANTRLIAASSRSRNVWLELPRGFSEEDLTRYLQITLDVFKDLQTSLQPRLHLEIGLLRLLHAGTLRTDRRSAGESGTWTGPPAPSKTSADQGTGRDPRRLTQAAAGALPPKPAPTALRRPSVDGLARTAARGAAGPRHARLPPTPSNIPRSPK